ncbi:M23 family metallopeptidase [Evansella cellulosilytica]|uniref:Peptidase M23 n=1 Tax=Evansella cellulosilytica (strain ATCC 21833 / DSM 2522 / FERM P-1141 / JCM 9156 / N-4) TaxID=649639 RepID=E6TUM6_EVAC2|nr:M23 family metallopeptidase [Evansella cellulosilytica]ADU30916.1 Peptidase M23 [Evansella cellulosilytica DSM 2522]
MKKLMLVFFSLLVFACSENENVKEDIEEETDNEVEEETEIDEGREAEEEITINELNIDFFQVDGNDVVLASELMEAIGGHYDYDETHRTIHIEVEGREFYLIYDVPVLEVDGEYLATDEVSLVVEDDLPYLTLAFIEEGLETSFQIEEDSELTFQWEESVIQAWSPRGEEAFDLYALSVEEMIDYLSFLQLPIEGAQVSTIESHLPGAPRSYRNGYHEGIDWYDYASGTAITTDTPIYAMAKGTVVRVDHDFEEYPSPLIRNKDLSVAAEIGTTPEFILDRLRGMQVWVQYENGVMNRFAHLDSIPEGLAVGDEVDASTIIGYVGNTGTSHSVNEDGGGLHLHQDLLIYGQFFWKPYSPEEVREILLSIWG